MELVQTTADPCHEVSVDPTLCDVPLDMKCRLFFSGLAKADGCKFGLPHDQQFIAEQNLKCLGHHLLGQIANIRSLVTSRSLSLSSSSVIAHHMALRFLRELSLNYWLHGRNGI